MILSQCSLRGGLIRYTISYMRDMLVALLLAVSAFAQSGNLGVFTNSDDVGAPPLEVPRSLTGYRAV